MKTSFTIPKSTDPMEALELPKGRLMVGELVADFSPENVVEAARVASAQRDQDFEDHTFLSQAGIIAYAAELGWNGSPEYKTI